MVFCKSDFLVYFLGVRVVFACSILISQCLFSMFLIRMVKKFVRLPEAALFLNYLI